ncbi:PP2C family protein-serine/threonine phosphatase [Actinokineospora pegani]|uniref:PP2C family protein-serine/threonine phosphatase n=1 Tax=Actinokineospora pegani TaxID=2654637 RepID=UPI0012E9BDAB|nr:PP2C family protein-serine/threonine phosphatase [Actinokineospora pegani]
MIAADSLRALGVALRALPLHSLADGLPAVLAEHVGVKGAVVRLVDYPAVQLVSVADPRDAVPIAGTVVGAAYREQQAVLDGPEAHLPLVCRGHCHGVLSGTVQDAELAELAEVADAVADALQVADVGTDQLTRARRDRRMTVAAEMQWDLLPARGLACAEFTLAGQLEPAYSVRGDNFDWSLDPGHLTLTLTNGWGEGMDAAVVTAIAISAMRNARRSGHGIAEAAALADQAVYGQYAGERSVAALLMSIDLATGAMSVVDCGSPELWLVRDEACTRIDLDRQVPLGAVEETLYRVQPERLLPGDRLVAVSDGVFDSSDGERTYADTSLPRTLRTTRGLPPAQVVRAVLSDLALFRDHRELDDDAVVVCLDWRG